MGVQKGSLAYCALSSFIKKFDSFLCLRKYSIASDASDFCVTVL